ncbi:hypothetical protein C0J52_27403 [Blattella germanica]|nr:hypothetical protein C0J52_27403 [Blattella germanica]
MPLSPQDVARAIALIDDGRSLRYAARTIDAPYTTVQEACVVGSYAVLDIQLTSNTSLFLECFSGAKIMELGSSSLISSKHFFQHLQIKIR